MMLLSATPLRLVPAVGTASRRAAWQPAEPPSQAAASERRVSLSAAPLLHARQPASELRVAAAAGAHAGPVTVTPAVTVQLETRLRRRRVHHRELAETNIFCSALLSLTPRRRWLSVAAENAAAPAPDDSTEMLTTGPFGIGVNGVSLRGN